MEALVIYRNFSGFLGVSERVPETVALQNDRVAKSFRCEIVTMQVGCSFQVGQINFLIGLIVKNMDRWPGLNEMLRNVLIRN